MTEKTNMNEPACDPGATALLEESIERGLNMIMGDFAGGEPTRTTILAHVFAAACGNYFAGGDAGAFKTLANYCLDAVSAKADTPDEAVDKFIEKMKKEGKIK